MLLIVPSARGELLLVGELLPAQLMEVNPGLGASDQWAAVRIVRVQQRDRPANQVRLS